MSLLEPQQIVSAVGRGTEHRTLARLGEHRRGFDATFRFYFKPDFPGGYTGVEFQSLSVRLRWFAQPYLKKSVLPAPLAALGSALGWLIDLFANLSPLVCSRLWCYYVGGFEEIEFVMLRPLHPAESHSSKAAKS